MTYGNHIRVRTAGVEVETFPMSISFQRPNGSWWRGSTGATNFSQRWYFMRDMVGYRHRYNPVKQVRWRWTNPYKTTFYFSSGNSPYVVSPYWVPRQSFCLAGVSASLKPGLGYEMTSLAWQNFVNEAVFSFQDQIPDDIDGLNAIHDILRLKSLFRQGTVNLYRIFNAARRFLSNNDGNLFRRSTLRELLSSAANLWLANEFGIKPMLRTFDAVLQRQSRILERLLFLRNSQGQVFSCHYSEKHTPTHPLTVNGWSDLSYSGHSVVQQYHCIQDEVTFGATAYVRNNLRGLNTLCSELEALLSGLGVGNVATFAWDLVPFSFVADWFVQTNRWLDRHASVQPFGGNLEVIDCGTSWKQRMTADLYLYSLDFLNGTLENGGKIEILNYRRERGLKADMSAFLPLSGLTPKQKAILSALVLQRVR